MQTQSNDLWNVVDAVQGGQTVVNFAHLTRFQSTTTGANLYFMGDSQPLHIQNRYEEIPTLIAESVSNIQHLTTRLRGVARAA